MRSVKLFDFYFCFVVLTIVMDKDKDKVWRHTGR